MIHELLCIQIEHQLWSARQQIESMLSAAGREGALALQELEGRLRGISDLDLLAWEHWCDFRAQKMPSPQLVLSSNCRQAVCHLADMRHWTSIHLECPKKALKGTEPKKLPAMEEQSSRVTGILDQRR